MGCGCQSGNKSEEKSFSQRSISITSPEDCYYTGEILINYLNLLNVVVENDEYSLYSLSKPQVNAYLGLIQSAINNPDNYCIFEKELDKFKNKVLPKLLMNS